MSDEPKDQRFTRIQNPALVAQHDRISKAIGRLTRDHAWDLGICAQCRKPVDGTPGDPTFSSEAKRREYWITAECQSCQDVTWASLKAMADEADTDVPNGLTQAAHSEQFDLFYTLTDIFPEGPNFFEQMVREGKAEYHIPVTCDSCGTTFAAVCKGVSGSFNCPKCNTEIQYELND